VGPACRARDPRILARQGGVGCATARRAVSKPRTTLLTIHPEHPEPHRIGQAVAHLEAGRVIVYPTDTLYGLAADLDNRGAIERLYSMRRLDPNKPLSLICQDLSQVARYAIMQDECYRFMKRVLPGPYTLILKATREAPRMGQNRRRAVGIRVPASPVAQALVAALGRPILSTSAAGLDEAAVSDPVELARIYGARDVALVLDAGMLFGTPSTVVDWSQDGPELVRQGAGDVSELFG
jgi:tRNA threonylcarbamoyl adenosine modification protein (Sua5/YciO/YrdC/YwlC family)